MKSHIYLDESGDLGFKFNAPYRDKGSSRFLTIGYLLCPITSCNVPQRLVRDVYHKFSFNPKVEMKASELKKHHKDFICECTVKMMQKNPLFILGAITVKKENVHPHIRLDGNKLYNYMMRLALIEKIEDHDSCKLTRDNRSIKVESGSSCIDYLQITIWFDKGKTTLLVDNPKHSHTDDGLIFIDWITNIVWSKYEDKYNGWCSIIQPYLQEIQLYFNKPADHNNFQISRVP